VLDPWNNFFLMVGGGAAALVGLIFVAMSINPESIIRNSTHKNRAINMLTRPDQVMAIRGRSRRVVAPQDPTISHASGSPRFRSRAAGRPSTSGSRFGSRP